MQEALTNVHRRCGSHPVEVYLLADKSRVILTVKDFGMGVPREVLDRFWKTGNVGVGLVGIRERLKELGGLLEIESEFDSTPVKAIPVSPADSVERDPSQSFSFSKDIA
jgi:signal transduction histidine kinase